MKKIVAGILLVMMIFTFTACGDNKVVNDNPSNSQASNNDNTQNNNVTASDSTDKKEDVTLEIFQFKVEIVDQLDALIEDFEKEYPYITVLADTAGGGQDYGALLKSRMNSGNQPAIFSILGPTERDLWIDYLEPLTDEKWVASASKGSLDNISKDDVVYGQPVGLEGYGVIYNKAIFDKAGIDASKINSLSSLEAAFETLESKKAELGIETVLSYSVGDSAWWTAAYHTFNIPFAMQEDPMAFIEGLTNGTATISGNDRFDGFLSLIDLFSKYSYNDLMTVSYDDQVANFALGKTACLHQGNWTVGMIQEITPDIDMAFLPIPLSDDAAWGNDSIPVGVPAFWAVNSQLEPEVIDAAKLFLNYIVGTERGEKFLIEDCKFIPAINGLSTQPSDPLAISILEYAKNGKTIPWVWHAFPSGFNEVDAKESIQKYYTGQFTREQFCSYLDEKWAEKTK